ncbi:MAG TPA: PilZ domain-containing protein [Vicinamibacterales bacterium]|nr:PilZ domain-containing protein [Vicinamibacterales bacterium]
MSHTERAARLDTHRVRIGTADGILLNLSASGALVRLPRLFNVQADVTLSLYADDRWLDVPCRIVRCTEMNVEMAGAVWTRKEFETAVTFHDDTALSSFLRS